MEYKNTKWLIFTIVERKPKTVVMQVNNKQKIDLGIIKWYGPWRQYIWIPVANTQFNNGCLQDITEVLTELNKNC